MFDILLEKRPRGVAELRYIMEYRKSQLKQKEKDNDTEEYPYNCDTDRLGVQCTDAENRALCA
jgi:membrane-bound inhibitor of C-type lysozyme